MSAFGAWRKSSYSNENGAACVELAWRKSSYSNENGAECVELAHDNDAVAIRDSKNPTGPVLTIPTTALTALNQHLSHSPE